MASDIPKRKGRAFPDSVRRDVLACINNSSMTVKEASESFGVSQGTIYSWLKQSQQQSTQPVSSTGSQRIAELEKQISEAKKHMEKVEAENVLLKKASAFLASKYPHLKN